MLEVKSDGAKLKKEKSNKKSNVSQTGWNYKERQEKVIRKMKSEMKPEYL